MNIIYNPPFGYVAEHKQIDFTVAETLNPCKTHVYYMKPAAIEHVVDYVNKLNERQDSPKLTLVGLKVIT